MAFILRSAMVLSRLARARARGRRGARVRVGVSKRKGGKGKCKDKSKYVRVSHLQRIVVLPLAVT